MSDPSRHLHSTYQTATRVGMVTSATPGKSVARSIRHAELCVLLPRISPISSKHIVRAYCLYCVSLLNTSSVSMKSTCSLYGTALIIALANVPVMWLFAARNDPLLWITGWSFATYNRFHRCVTRISTLQAIVHSIAYSVYMYYEGTGLHEGEWKYRCWYTGAIVRENATCLLLLVS